MQVNRARVNQQADNITKLTKSASNVIRESLTDDMPLDDIIRLADTVSEAYANMSGAVTAQFYNDIRAAAKPPSKFTATKHTHYLTADTRKAVVAVYEEYTAGRATVPLANLVSDIVARNIKKAADATISVNGSRDTSKPRYAIVPTGDACAFCVMRASNGYTYELPDAVNSHDHCSCVATPVWGSMTVQGYDVEKYRSMWREARDAYYGDDLSDDMYDKIDDQWDEKGKEFSNTKAILMVMREQQGLK